LPAEARNGAQVETKSDADRDGGPEAPMPATDEGEKIQTLAGGEPDFKVLAE